MKIGYASNKLEKQLSTPTEIKKAFGKMALKISQRLDEIKSSDTLDDLMLIPAAKCHSLSGVREGQWAVKVSGNHRMIFVLANNPIPTNEDKSVDKTNITDIEIISIEDYH